MSSVISMVADPGGVDPDPEPTLKRKNKSSGSGLITKLSCQYILEYFEVYYICIYYIYTI